MEILYQIADLLGWTALHAIWQIILISLLLKLLLQFIPGKEYDLKLALFAGAIGLTLISTLSTLIYLIDLRSPLQEAVTHWPETYYMYYSLTETAQSQSIWDWFEGYSHWMGIFWLSGTLSVAIYWAGGYYFLKRLQSKAKGLHGQYYDKIIQWCEEAGLNKAPDLRVSSQIASPVLTGFLQPIILLPSGMLQVFDEEQVECILRHEWLHWKRNDHLINLALAIFEAIFFFHPLSWWMTKEFRHLQELIVDRETIRHTQQPIQYAKTLYEVQKLALQPSVGMTAFSAEKGNLLHRIEQILSPYPHSKTKIMKTQNIGIVFLSGIFISLISLAAYSMDATTNPEPDAKVIEAEVNSEMAETLAFYPKFKGTLPKTTSEKSGSQSLPKGENTNTKAVSENAESQLSYLPLRALAVAFHKPYGNSIKTPAISFGASIRQPQSDLNVQVHKPEGMLPSFLQDTTPSEEEWKEFEQRMQVYAQRMAEWGQEYAKKIQKHMPPQDSIQKMISELQRKMQEEKWTEEEKEIFEQKMEAYGQRMEEWGERFGEMMERWAEKYEQEMERMGEEMESIEKPPLPPPPPPPPPLPDVPEEPKGEE